MAETAFESEGLGPIPGYLVSFKYRGLDLPGGTVGKNLPANGGNTGSIPWSRKIPHAMEPLSL